MVRRISILGAVTVAAAMASPGCSDPYQGRLEVTGVVRLTGQPLKDGSISFEPLDGQGTQSGAPVADGKYTVPGKSGLKPGKYLVRITAGDGRTVANEEAGAPGGSTNIVSVDLIPDDWNSQSKQIREIKAKVVNTLDFEIPNVNPRARRR
jgi:hypothetical protein